MFLEGGAVVVLELYLRPCTCVTTGPRYITGSSEYIHFYKVKNQYKNLTNFFLFILLLNFQFYMLA